MAAEFLDTNLIIRFLTQDDPGQAERSRRLFKELEAGTRSIATSEAVIIEAVQVLSSRALYGLSRQEIQTHLDAIISLRGLRLPHKRTFLRALDRYASTNLDFVDALSVAHMERAKITTIVSFDPDFDRIQGIERREP